MSDDWSQQYPGDEVVMKSITQVLHDACEQKGISPEQAFEKYQEVIDPQSHRPEHEECP
jgi:hypothetical protein